MSTVLSVHQKVSKFVLQNAGKNTEIEGQGHNSKIQSLVIPTVESNIKANNQLIIRFLYFLSRMIKAARKGIKTWKRKCLIPLILILLSH